jgi:RNA polymerase sigma-70 factor (ECF subfamily)
MLRAKNPTSSSDELAEMFSASDQVQVSAEWVRQKLHRARKKFAEFLLAEVRRSLVSGDEEAIEDELRLLGLQKYIA